MASTYDIQHMFFKRQMYSDINVSQDSVAPPVRCGGIFCDFLITNFLRILLVKEL